MDDTIRLNNEYGAAILPGRVLKIFTHDRTGPTVTLDEQAMHALIDFLCSAMGGCDLLKDEMARADRLALTTRPAPLQGPNPAMTLGAAAEPDAPHLGVQFENGTWALTVGGLVHNGYDYGMALALAVTVGGKVRDIDEWKEEQMALHVQVAMGATVSDH